MMCRFLIQILIIFLWMCSQVAASATPTENSASLEDEKGVGDKVASWFKTFHYGVDLSLAYAAMGVSYKGDNLQDTSHCEDAKDNWCFLWLNPSNVSGVSFVARQPYDPKSWYYLALRNEFVLRFYNTSLREPNYQIEELKFRAISTHYGLHVVLGLVPAIEYFPDMFLKAGGASGLVLVNESINDHKTTRGMATAGEFYELEVFFKRTEETQSSLFFFREGGFFFSHSHAGYSNVRYVFGRAGLGLKYSRKIFD